MSTLINQSRYLDTERQMRHTRSKYPDTERQMRHTKAKYMDTETQMGRTKTGGDGKGQVGAHAHDKGGDEGRGRRGRDQRLAHLVLPHAPHQHDQHLI